MFTKSNDRCTNTAPVFVGGDIALTLEQDSPAVDLIPYLHVSDSDSTQKLSWSKSVEPKYGKLLVAEAIADSGGNDIIPGGTITYQPNPGFCGTDSFTVQVSDGTITTSRIFFVTVKATVNAAPTFVGGNTILTLAYNSPAVDLKPNLHVSDTTTGQTLTWSENIAPSHGILLIKDATASSGGTDIIPNGTITYRPTPGYSGSDSFTVQVSDSKATVTRTFSVMVKAAVIDYGHLDVAWTKLIGQIRPDAISNLLKVSTRISKLNPVAESALAVIKPQISLSAAEQRVLIDKITTKGWATNLDRVIKRINMLRISENKRVILATAYPWLLNALLISANKSDEEKAEALKDTLGFTEEILFELEKEGGPLAKFVDAVVNEVGTKHRINFSSSILRSLIAQQVRMGL